MQLVVRVLKQAVLPLDGVLVSEALPQVLVPVAQRPLQVSEEALLLQQHALCVELLLYGDVLSQVDLASVALFVAVSQLPEGGLELRHAPSR